MFKVKSRNLINKTNKSLARIIEIIRAALIINLGAFIKATITAQFLEAAESLSRSSSVSEN